MLDRIDKYIKNTSFTKVYVEVEGDDDTYVGIPIRRSKSLLAIHQLNDFHFNGYRIVRLQDIVKIRRGKFEMTLQKIMKSTGEIEKHANPGWIRLGTWQSLLACLKKKKTCICISSGFIDVDVFAVGEVQTLNANSVILKSFDATGKWCKPKHNIKFSDITEVQFGDEYSTVFHQYVKNS